MLSVVTTLPYLAAEFRAPQSHVFTGVLTAYDDTFTYLAWMRQAEDGHLLMCDLYTSESQSCEFFLPLWTLLGGLARLTALPLAAVFHIARLAAAFLLLVVARSAARTVIKSRTRLRYALWMYAFSGGLGWVIFISRNWSSLLTATGGSGSADLNLPEAIAFRAVFAQVHFSAGIILVAGSLILFFRALMEDRPSGAFASGALVSALAVVHPYLVIVVGAVVLAALVAKPWCVKRSDGVFASYSRAAPVTIAFGAAAIPGLAYLVYLNRSNNVLREWLRITDTRSPAPLDYVLGFGVVAALGVAGFWLLARRHSGYGRLLLIWALIQTMLLYAPVSFQRRFVEGLQLPFAIAATAAIFWVATRLFRGRARGRRRRWALAAVLIFSSLTNIGFAAGQLIGRGPAAEDPRRFLRSDVIEALDWLRKNSPPDSVLFSSYLIGNVAPPMTGLRVFLGHYGQTIDSNGKGEQVTAFYSNQMAEEAARQMFAEHRASYVIYGPLERELGGNFAPPSWLVLVHKVGEVEVFKVQSL